MSNAYIADRALHWISAVILLYMLMVISSELHTVDWQIKGQVEHRQDAIQSHATAGIALLLVTFIRIIFSIKFDDSLPRTKPRTNKHRLFIRVTHFLLYGVIAVMIVTGIGMALNYDIPLTIYGFEIGPDREAYYAFAVELRDIHLMARTALWWLIGLHLVGIIYSKR